jgi:hypothetical protein
MKRSLLMTFCVCVGFALAGCCATDHREYGCSPQAGYPPCHPGSLCYTNRWDDGYSFSNDPYNHDALAPFLGLDPLFPPAPQPVTVRVP